MVRHNKPPSQKWRTFLKNHAKDLVSIDFFVVPSITFQLLFAFVILGHDRRRPVHFAVTANPTAEWTARQLLVAFAWDNAQRYLLHDRDAIYGEKFCQTSRWMGIHEVLTAPQSPWQNAYVELFIGSIRRECLDHVMVFHEAGLRRILKGYFEYYERCRTHLSLEKDAPVSRPVEPPSLGHVIEIPKSVDCTTFTGAKLPDRKRLPSARLRIQSETRSRSSCEGSALQQQTLPRRHLRRGVTA